TVRARRTHGSLRAPRAGRTLLSPWTALLSRLCVDLVEAVVAHRLGNAHARHPHCGDQGRHERRRYRLHPLAPCVPLTSIETDPLRPAERSASARTPKSSPTSWTHL